MKSVIEIVVQKMKTHVLCSITFFSEKLVVYEIVLKNLVWTEATSDFTIWRICGACLISKATKSHAHAHARTPVHPHSLTHASTHTQTNMY